MPQILFKKKTEKEVNTDEPNFILSHHFLIYVYYGDSFAAEL